MPSPESKNPKIVGGEQDPSIWERFNRLQRTTNLGLRGSVNPRGVFRFRTFEEFNAWKEALQQGHSKKTT